MILSSRNNTTFDQLLRSTCKSQAISVCSLCVFPVPVYISSLPFFSPIKTIFAQELETLDQVWRFTHVLP